MFRIRQQRKRKLGGKIRFAHTAPVFIDREHKPFAPRRYAAEYFLRKTNELIEEADPTDYQTEGAFEATMNVYRQAVVIFKVLLSKSR